MATDLISALANIVANARQANQPIAIHSPAQFTPFTAGHSKSTGTTNLSELSSSNYTANQGWGPVGEAFGKGAGDFINETVLKAAKNKYAMENDPMEIEKRATQLFNVYQQAGPEEQKKIEWMLNNTPEGLKWRDKIKKHAGYLLTPYPDTLEESGSPHPKAGQFSFTKVQPDEKMQRARALSAMPQQQREGVMFAQEAQQQGAAQHSMAEAAKAKLETQQLPEKLALDRQQMELNARRTAAEERQVAVMEERMKIEKAQSPSIIAAHMADAAYKRAHADSLLKNGDPEAARVALQNERERQQLLNTAYGKHQDFLKNVMSGNFTPKQKVQYSLASTVKTAGEMKTIDPTNPTAIGMFRNAAQDILNSYRDYRIKYQKDSNTTIDPEMAARANDLITSWGNNLGSTSEFDEFLRVRKDLMRSYWRQFYPDLTKDQGGDAWNRIVEEENQLRANVLPQLKKREMVIKNNLPRY